MIPGPLSVHECAVLGELAAAATASRALEVGHYLGLSTSVLLDHLPEGCELVTIDHHKGDDWCPATSVVEFETNIAPHIGDRPFRSINNDMRTVLPALEGRFGFVFYDADHTADAVTEFWKLAEPLLEPECTLVFDDADWTDQGFLRVLAETDGFEVIRTEPFVRHQADKHDHNTYTLEIMVRVL